MARVVRRAASAAAWRAPSRAIQRRARKHKVIMESVTQEKKKLRSVICFEAKAPTGYTFIPAGNPHLTTACKERCRKENIQIYAVSTTPHLHTHNLSQHVHRIGYHFPSTVVAAVCSELGLYLTNSGKAVPFHTLGSLANRPSSDPEASQEVINTEARDTIKDLFPNIPDKDLFQIIKTSFQKGQRKVGTASELPLARRAQLAVVAHVRHLYTDYDRLLKQGSFHDARSAVEQPTLAKVVAWRGDDENGQAELEDVFREVIVISDDDDDSETDDEIVTASETRDESVIILSNIPRTHEIQTQPISADNVPNQDPTREFSEEAAPGFRIFTKMPAKRTIDRRGFSRYQAWNRALSRYRADAQDTEQPQVGDAPIEQQSPRYVNRPTVVQENPVPARRRELPTHPMELNNPRIFSGPPSGELPALRPLMATPSHVGVMERRAPLESQQPQRPFPQFGSGRPQVLTMQKPHDVQISDPRSVSTTHQGKPQFMVGSTRPERNHMPPSGEKINAPLFPGGPQEFPNGSKGQLGPGLGSRTETPKSSHTRSGVHPQDHVLPSIEGPWPLEKRRADTRLESMTKRMSLRSVTPSHPSGETHGNVSGSGSPDDQTSKRRRLAYYPGLQHDSHYVPRDVRPIGMSIPVTISEEQNRVQYRNIDGLGSEHRSQDVQQSLRRDYPPPGDHSLLIGHQRERPPAPFTSQVNLSTRREMDRRVIDPMGHVPMHTTMPSSGVSAAMGISGDRSYRAAVDSTSRPELRPPYFVDRSPRMDHVRQSKIEEPHPTIWNPRIDGDRPLVHDPGSGKQYADGFVRSVDVRESRPLEYFIEHPRHQPNHQPIRTRIPDQHAQDLSQPRDPSEQHQLPSVRVIQTSAHHQIPHHTESAPGSRQSHGRIPPRERRPGSGLSNARRVHDPRAFQMVEQNRPIYVQRVESQPPQYSMSDSGRPAVIVD
ncbi:hypothetical protein N7488_012223 [Penicillium malachiteum]|nr:hypothetical protein N7488_012223 [Penicillium malachiteum]